jgi:hypothetical protein
MAPPPCGGECEKRVILYSQKQGGEEKKTGSEQLIKVMSVILSMYVFVNV